MKPVDQTLFGTENGNCFQACVASLLEVPIDSLPHFVMMRGEIGNTGERSADWFDHFDHWMKSRGLYSVECSLKHESIMACVSEDSFCILTGKSNRGCNHAVVGCTGSPVSVEGFLLIHDPHPSREFFGGNVPDWVMFIGRRLP